MSASKHERTRTTMLLTVAGCFFGALKWFFREGTAPAEVFLFAALLVVLVAASFLAGIADERLEP